MELIAAAQDNRSYSAECELVFLLINLGHLHGLFLDLKEGTII